MPEPTYFICKSVISGHLSMVTPVGELQIQASTNGVISVLLNEQKTKKTEPTPVDGVDLSAQRKIIAHLAQAKKELEAYFRGDLTQFHVTLDLRGTDFQQQVWSELQKIGYAESCSYLNIAERISHPKAARAVGAANRANPVAIIVPCHRVVGKNGKLTGYAYGLEMKQYLLNLESRFP